MQEKLCYYSIRRENVSYITDDNRRSTSLIPTMVEREAEYHNLCWNFQNKGSDNIITIDTVLSLIACIIAAISLYHDCKKK